MKNLLFHKTPVGVIGIAESNGCITDIFFGDKIKSGMSECTTPLLRQAASELDEYFVSQRRRFTLPLSAEGTEFQRNVWHALEAVPYGQTCSYGEIAAAIGKPKASRAIGQANNRNPIAIVIPCHRVIGANGKLTGYGGGIDVKERLLAIEGIL